MKYIDADKLIAEIERYKKGAAIARFDNAGENGDYFQGKVDLCNDLTHIITSLQQEQQQGLGEATYQYTHKQDFNTIRENPFTSVGRAFQAGAHWMRNIVWHSATDDKPEPGKALLVKTKPDDAYMLLSSNSDDFNKIALEWAYIKDLIPIW